MNDLILRFDPKTRLIEAAKNPPAVGVCRGCGEVLAGDGYGIGLAVRSAAVGGAPEKCPGCARARCAEPATQTPTA